MVNWIRLGRAWLVLALVCGALGAGAHGAGAAGLPLGGPRAIALGSAPANPPGCASAVFPFGRNVNTPIPDASSGPNPTPGVVTSTVSGFGLGAYVWDVNVSVNISHTFSGDVDIFLISPHGTRVTLAHHNGTSLDNLYDGATFDDQAGLTVTPGPVTLVPYLNSVPVGLVNPQEPLSAFNGENPDGTWTLEVRDTAHGDVGVLKSWSLQIIVLNSVPTVVPGQVATSNAVTPIPDGSGQVDIPLPIADFVPLSALTVTTVITHPATRDLVLELVSPTGVSLVVSDRNPLTNTSAYANVFAGTTWFDSAGAVNPPGPVTDNDYTSGVVQTPLSPQEGFAELNGTNATGTWHLLVRDIVSGQAGTLGRVSLGTAGLSCAPALATFVGTPNRFNRLGKPLKVTVFVDNLAAPASNLLLSTGISGPYAYQSSDGPGWTCAPPPVGTLSPTMDCVRASQTQTTTSVSITVTAPLVPQPSGISAPVSSNPAGLIPPASGVGALLTSYAQSGNGNPWDVLDGLNTDFGFPPDSGSIHLGGQGAFFSFGQIQVRSLSLSGTLLGAATPQNLLLTYAPGHRWNAHSIPFVGGVSVRRDILAPAGADWLRYVDHFQNGNAAATRVVVSWGGLLFSLSQTKTAATSSGDLTLAANDTWAVTFQQDQPNGPAVKPPIGLAFRSPSDSSYQGPYLFSGNPFTSTVWPSLGNGSLGQVFSFVLQPGETRALAYFVARGLAEGTPGPADCDYYGGCVTPATGSQVALIENTVAGLAANPPFCDLSPSERALIVNWPGVVEHCLSLPVVLR